VDEPVFTASVDGRTPAVVRLTGELDLAGVPLLYSALEGLDGDVELDCSGLEFIDAAGLTGLVRTHEACAARGSKLVLLHPSPAVDRLLRLVELDTVLSICRERESC
jgi:anti-sigma B factor antagonist